MTQPAGSTARTGKIPLCGSVFAQKYPFAVQKIPLCGSVLSCKPASVKGEISLKVFKTVKRAFYADRLWGRQRNATPYLPHRISDPRSPATWCRILQEVYPAQDTDQGREIYGHLSEVDRLKNARPREAAPKPHILTHLKKTQALLAQHYGHYFCQQTQTTYWEPQHACPCTCEGVKGNQP